MGSKRGSLKGYAVAACCGLLFFAAVHQGLASGRLAWLKATGAAVDCPWPALLRVPRDAQWLADRRAQIARELSVVNVDPGLGIEQIRTRDRTFWLKKDSQDMAGPALLAYLLADHEAMSTMNPHYVRKGDVVIDVGAHVGAFTAQALAHGASAVVMVEPEPVNIECLRRNFAAEIASGRVILIAEGAWSSESTLKLFTGLSNSGMNTMVLPEAGAGYVEVKTRPIDQMVAIAGLTRVDFIKIDIEGAERDALKGAARTLARWKPRLMLDAYHRPDDPVVLPAVIPAGNAAYQLACVSCGMEADGTKIRPYLLAAW
jgi:FkbM family methyltransferase